MSRNIQRAGYILSKVLIFTQSSSSFWQKLHSESGYSVTRLHWKVGGSGLCQKLVKGIDGTLLFLHSR